MRTESKSPSQDNPPIFLYFLMAGNCSNYFIVDERDGFKELYAGDISPGELFGISAVIEPYISTMGVPGEWRSQGNQNRGQAHVDNFRGRPQAGL
jgi:hypothetical protein